MIESTPRISGLRIAPRTARPSTTPATSPITTSDRIKNSAANNFGRDPLMWLTMCGAINTPATPPSSTPTNDSSDPSAPERHPEIAAMNAIATIAISSHCDELIGSPSSSPLAHQRHRLVQGAHIGGVPRSRPPGDVEHRRDHLPGEAPDQHLVEQERRPGPAAGARITVDHQAVLRVEERAQRHPR